MKARKGVGTVGMVIFFSIGIMVFTGNMIIMNAAGNQDAFNKDVHKTVKFQLADIKQNSVMTLILEDHMWRHEGISYEKYGNRKFKKVASLYFATEGDRVFFDKNNYSVQNVRGDLQKYTEMKLDRYWLDAPNSVGYKAIIRSDGSPQSPISVGSFSGTGSKSSYTLPKDGGEEVNMIVYIDSGNSIFGVESGG